MLRKYAGKYELDPGSIPAVTLADKPLSAQLTDQP